LHLKTLEIWTFFELLTLAKNICYNQNWNFLMGNAMSAAVDPLNYEIKKIINFQYDE
jgi:hypothetical protein